MSSIPFIEARFFDPDETQIAPERRLSEHLRRMRAHDLPSAGSEKAAEDDGDDLGLEFDSSEMVSLGEKDRRRIRRRVERLLERRKAASGLAHLKREERDRLGTLRGGAQLIAISSEHRADELAAALHDDMRWMASATEVVWHAMRRPVREGWPGLRLPPLLLDGPPGIGKSHWARRLGEVLSAPVSVIEATGENASFGVVGSQRGWGGACPGRLIETVLQTGIANPVIVVDEVEKAGQAVSTKGQAFGLAEALLPLLEPMTARRWSCPCYQVKFDMGWVGWVLTSNNWHLLPEPLLNRCPPLRLRELTSVELAGFIRREGMKRDLSEAAIDAILGALAHAWSRSHRPSLRVASRLLQHAVELEHTPVRH